MKFIILILFVARINIPSQLVLLHDKISLLHGLGLINSSLPTQGRLGLRINLVRLIPARITSLFDLRE